MNRALSQIAEAIDHALEECAAAVDMQLIPREAEAHWTSALNYFLWCVQVCSQQQQQAREKARRR